MIAEPEVSFDYTLSYRQFVAGHKLAARKSAVLFLVHLLGRFIAPTAAILVTLMCLVNWSTGHGSLVPPILPLFFLLFLLSMILPISWRFGFRRLQLSSRQDPKMTFQADRTSFARQVQGMGDLTWLWSATHSIADNQKIVLISVRRGSFLFIPRHVVSDDQLDRLKEFLRVNRAN
jgi:hypothetical protein